VCSKACHDFTRRAFAKYRFADAHDVLAPSPINATLCKRSPLLSDGSTTFRGREH